MLKTKFTKYSGAGNDFIIFLADDLGDQVPSYTQIKMICDRRFGVGGDGVIILNSSDNYDFSMQYFNSDGNPGSLCGNGARCAIKHAYEAGIIKSKTTKFNVGKDSYKGEILDEGFIKFQLNNPLKIKTSFKIKILDQLVESSFADTGSPHVVINCSDILKQPNNPRSAYDNISELPVKEIGELVRNHHDFAPEGTNVNFIELSDNILKIRTYERGVEAETLACGTGSVAASIIASLKYGYSTPVKLLTFGGDELKVEFDKNENSFSNISLTGPALKIFEGKILL